MKTDPFKDMPRRKPAKVWCENCGAVQDEDDERDWPMVYKDEQETQHLCPDC